MIEEVFVNIYRIVIPLPLPVVGSMNAYVVTDPHRNLIVDPGMAHIHSLEALQEGLNELGIDLGRTDFFATHHHLDHFSLVCRILNHGSTIYINGLEAECIEEIASGKALTAFTRLLEVMGFPEEDPLKVMPQLDGSEYRAKQPLPFQCIEEGSVIERGGYRFRCVVTPGHSLAHTCLYEPDRRIIFAGDSISPVLQFLSDRANPSVDYLKSLDRLSRMEIDTVLPGHRSPFSDYRKKIDRLKAHHKERCSTILAALVKDAGEDSCEVAARVWRKETDGLDWDALSMIWRFFSTRECFAYLRHLEVQGRVRVVMENKRMLFSVHPEAPDENRL